MNILYIRFIVYYWVCFYLKAHQANFLHTMQWLVEFLKRLPLQVWRQCSLLWRWAADWHVDIISYDFYTEHYEECTLFYIWFMLILFFEYKYQIVCIFNTLSLNVWDDKSLDHFFPENTARHCIYYKCFTNKFMLFVDEPTLAVIQSNKQDRHVVTTQNWRYKYYRLLHSR